MTDRTPPSTAPAPGLQAFALQPGRLEQERSRAERTGRLCRGVWCTQTCEPVLIQQRT
ncbi:hypothetical protein ACWGQ5_34985 [Streptomyces sp. NPDC055722]|jgi:hypothetical protein